MIKAPKTIPIPAPAPAKPKVDNPAPIIFAGPKKILSMKD